MRFPKSDEKDTLMNIGEKIKELRTSKMMTQAELAGDQITRNMLSLIERGAATPSLQTVLYLASRLQVPPGFLLAEGVDEFSYRKMSRISNIRAAYRSGDYKSCRSICRQELDGTDDEISLILAECDTGIGEEEFLAGHLHSACRFFDEALEYADKTVYRTDYVRAVSALYFRYMNDFSHTLYSEVSDEEPGGGAIGENPICAYIRAYFAVREGKEEEVGRYLESAGDSVLASHIRICRMLAAEEYAEALGELERLLGSDTEIPQILLYHFTAQMEVCYRETGDYKGAYDSARSKVELFEKLLEDVS